MNDPLKVLDMSEEEQFQWLIEKGITDGALARSQVTHKIVTRWIRIELADLAFRLRDEANKEDEYKWWKACYTVIHGKVDVYANVGDGHEAEYEVLKRDPIVWIIVALKAKES
ncbi:hypothetical protein LCGC14_1134250 [marine sediment metagenome]|uniref:Uncharacterized protein n=1 Tax=marine sediment metagenome TaxID=412755 RepID=A0A0F9M0B1_9ZZZZ|nr:hypothetical protein [Candidatus Aminicenantes bacterium]